MHLLQLVFLIVAILVQGTRKEHTNTQYNFRYVVTAQHFASMEQSRVFIPFNSIGRKEVSWDDSSAFNLKKFFHVFAKSPDIDIF